ncbi:MAG TPA: carboxylic ester hydrolase [Casimicrobiaceae bacterium]|nr:carboxylic ester hydrolase [Casimicrobiaceae bacterium]
MNSAARMIVLAVLAVLTVGAALWVVIFPTPRFPRPTGSYGIGTRVYAWTDPARPEPFTADAGDRRELVAQVWYPATGQGAPRRYLDSGEPLRVLARRLHLPAFLLRNVRHAPTHALEDAPAAEGRFPVLVNAAGLLVFRDASLFWIEELVSHGYVVVGLDQPGTAAATQLADGRIIRAIDKPVFDRYMPIALSQGPAASPTLNGVALPGGVIPFLADDLRFVLGRMEILDHGDPVLAGHVDTGRAGAFGMSLGGYVAPEACYRDRRFRACVAVDAGKTAAVARDGLAQPVMIIGRDADVMRDERRKAGGWPESEITHTIGSQRALFDHNRADAYYVTMNGMYHVNWTDAPLWSPIVRWIGLAGPIDPYQGFAETNAYTLAFFDRYLKGKSATLLDEAPGRQKGARLEVRRVPARD